MIDLRNYCTIARPSAIGFTMPTWYGIIWLKIDGSIEFRSSSPKDTSFDSIGDALDYADKVFKTNAYEVAPK